MSFTDVFIKRPVFAASISLLIFVIGLIALSSLTIRQYPKLEANVIAISTSYPGANAETVESFVTTQVEDAISGVDGIDYITSSSSAEDSNVVINLALNSDVNTALEDINSNIASVLHKLPEGVEDPVISKADPNSMSALIVGFTSQTETSQKITDYINRVIVPQVSTISGVGSTDIFGSHTYAMRLWLDPKKMAALGVTAIDVEDALKDNNVQAQPGQIDRVNQIVSIDAKTDLNNVLEFNNLAVKQSAGQLVKISDIGKAELGSQNSSSSIYIDGKNGVALSVTIKSTANPLIVSKDIKNTLTRLEKQMPSDMAMFFARDATKYIENSIHEVVRTIIEAALFVFIVIFIFIGSFRSVLIPIVTIPLSLTGAFAFMFMMGYSLNTLTLLAFVLAIGMVVDDAIVVLENIHRHIEKGLAPYEAALTGAKEISFPVIAMTFTLAAVYAPIGFTSGFTSILFKEFAFTLAGTVIVSGFIALTLTPMMCSKIMKNTSKEARLSHFINSAFTKINNWYTHRLLNVLENRFKVIFTLVAVLIIGVIFFMPLQKQSTLAPDEDQGVVIGMASGPTGSNLNYTQKYTAMLEPIYQSIEEGDGYAIINGHPGGESHAMTFLSLIDWGDRGRPAQVIQQEIMQKAAAIPGMRFMFFSPSSIPGSNSIYPLEIVLKTTGSYGDLNDYATNLANKLQENPGIMRVQSDLALDSPQVEIVFNRGQAAILDVSMDDINTALKVALGEPDITSFVLDGRAYNVIPQLSEQFRADPADLNNINVATQSGELIPLSNLATIKDTVAASSLNHFQQQRSATLSMVLADGFSQQQAISYFEYVAAQELPATITYDFSGDTRQFIESGSSMLKIFIFALLFIYLVLSAQFESFSDPFVVMFTVPLSLVGALLTLYCVGGSLNIYTEIGLITLVGLISKHGILIVEFANQEQQRGAALKEAIVKAATVRLRPILMTTAAMVLGALPLILAGGAGAAAREQIGWTIVGGMTFGTALTLFIIPTIYTFIACNKSSQGK
jgi:multidrug efflux pump